MQVLKKTLGEPEGESYRCLSAAGSLRPLPTAPHESAGVLRTPRALRGVLATSYSARWKIGKYRGSRAPVSVENKSCRRRCQRLADPEFPISTPV